MSKLTPEQLEERKKWVRLWSEGEQLQSRQISDVTEWQNLRGIDDDTPAPVFDVANRQYREKNEPLELWVNVYKSNNSKLEYECMIHNTECSALEYTSEDAIRTAVHMKEVTEDEKD